MNTPANVEQCAAGHLDTGCTEARDAVETGPLGAGQKGRFVTSLPFAFQRGLPRRRCVKASLRSQAILLLSPGSHCHPLAISARTPSCLPPAKSALTRSLVDQR